MRDSEMFQLRLAKDQAVAQADRLKSKLDELLASTAAAGGGGGGGAAAAPSSSRGAAGRAGSGGGGGGVMSAKEAELLSTVANLKAALEKSTAGAVPNTKYMAVSVDDD